MISMDSDHQSYIHWAIDFKMPAIWSEKPNLPFVQYSPWNLKPRIIDYVMHDCTSCICCELHLIIIAISAPFIGWYTLSCHLMVYTVLSLDGILCLVIGWYGMYTVTVLYLLLKPPQHTHLAYFLCNCQLLETSIQYMNRIGMHSNEHSK